jgi:hypothetical protein
MRFFGAMVLAGALLLHPAAARADAAGGNLLLDDFSGATASNGQSWWSGCDSGHLGTTLAPQPFTHKKGSARIHGHLGKGMAPWPWACMSLHMAQPDFRPYKALSFYAKGDGGHYRVQICRLAVKDFCFHQATFTAPKDWTLVRIPLTHFDQPSDWGQSVPADFKDVDKLVFGTTVTDTDYDFSISGLTLVK